MASACEKCHYFICRCGELKALRAENEKLKEQQETVLKYLNSVSYNNEEKVKAANQALKG